MYKYEQEASRNIEPFKTLETSSISPQDHLPAYSQGETPAKVITLHLSLKACEHIFLLETLSFWRVACVKITDGVLIGKAFHDALQIGALGNAGEGLSLHFTFWRTLTTAEQSMQRLLLFQVQLHDVKRVGSTHHTVHVDYSSNVIAILTGYIGLKGICPKF